MDIQFFGFNKHFYYKRFWDMKQKKISQLFNKHLKLLAIKKCIFELLSIPVSLLNAILLSKMVTCAISGRTIEVLKLGVLLIIILICFTFFNISFQIKQKQIASNFINRCKIELYNLFFDLPLTTLYSYNNGQAKERLNDDFSRVVNKTLALYPDLFICIITVSLYFIFIAKNSFLCSIILLTMGTIQVVPPIITKNFFQKNYLDTRDVEAELTNCTIEAYEGFLSIKFYNLKKWYLTKLKKIQKKYLKIGNKGIWTATTENTITSFISNILKYGACVIFGMLVLNNKISVDLAVHIIALSNSFFKAITTIFSSISKFGVTKEAELRLSEWYTDDHDEYEINGCEIHLRNVSHCYGNTAILDNITENFPSKGICVIKGTNGVGKSTLLKLITGLIHIQNGFIDVGGISTNNFSEENYLHKICYLPQENIEFDIEPFELMNMIKGIDLNSVKEILRKFLLDDDLLNNTKICNLSGGESKKFFLSLVLSSPNALLLLDEPTNSLDEHSKQILIQELKIRSGLTIIVTHDSFFDDKCDCLAIIESGEIRFEKR